MRGNHPAPPRRSGALQNHEAEGVVVLGAGLVLFPEDLAPLIRIELREPSVGVG